MGWLSLPDGSAKLDVGSFLEQMEDELRHGATEERRVHILAALWRWQWDAMLREQSRVRARAPAREFGALETLFSFHQ